MKLVFMTDTHGRANNPSSRKDDFPETVLKKISWVIDFANKNDAAVLHGGDWLHRPDVTPAFISRLAEVLSNCNNPIFTVVGNHDIYGYNPRTFERTPFHIVQALGVLKRLHPEGLVYEKDGERVCLSGADAQYDVDSTPDAYMTAGSEIQENIPRIHVVHGFLTLNEWPNVACTVLDKVLDTQADILLTGHEHSGYGVIKKNGKIFCNPGSLLRVTAGVGDINQDVKVALINVEGGASDIELVRLPLDIARPADEVLDREKLLSEKEHERRMLSFSTNLESASLDDLSKESGNIFEVFRAYAEKESLSPAVVSFINKKLAEAEEMRANL